MCKLRKVVLLAICMNGCVLRWGSFAGGHFSRVVRRRMGVSPGAQEVDNTGATKSFLRLASRPTQHCFGEMLLLRLWEFRTVEVGSCFLLARVARDGRVSVWAATSGRRLHGKGSLPSKVQAS